ncbi:hypothetical protein Tco_1096025 [Tanacetum coccineum]
MEKSESYLVAPEHQDCYDSLKKSFNLDKYFFFSYDVYTIKRSRQDKDEDPSAGSDRGLKKRKTSKDADTTTGSKKKDSTSGYSKDTKSQPKASYEGNLDDNDDKPSKEAASRCDWFKKPSPPQEPTDHDWNIGKTP